MRWIGRSAHEIAAAVRGGEVTATEVVRQHLEHIRAVDPQVGAFVLTRDGAALAEAGRLDDSDLSGLPLAGVPVAVKDVVDVVGHPTRHGSLATRQTDADRDDPTVERLRAAGAVIVGKTRCPELSVWGTSDTAQGTARNPWDLDRTPGGSSGGSAAAVSSGMVPLALASDGMGSVRIPAACTGLVGIKPGSGIVPMQFGDDDEHWSGMTQYGPLATNVTDLALMLDVLAGGAGLDEVTLPDRALRIGISIQPVLAGTFVSGAWKRACRELGDVLEDAGHVVVRTKLPSTIGDVLATTTRWTRGCGDDIEALGVDARLLQKRTRRQARAGRLLERLRPRHPGQAASFQGRVAEMFGDIDVLLSPTLLRAPIAADGWRDRGWIANLVANANYASMTGPWNFADVPAAAVPAGIDEDGMPLSVQVVGPHGGERVVLQVLAQIEHRRPWKTHAPLVAAALTG